ncbi:MAG: hypothetical protein J5486_03425 [Bacteroidaceae bacterium]|nr:hypothetical protein [Bacteroidaceae bacterium]
MNKKNLFCGLACMATLSAPVTMTSCNEDEIVQTINTINTLVELFSNSNELSGTAWMDGNTWSESTLGIEFSNKSQGVIYDAYTNDGEGREFTYTMDSTNNTITLAFSSGSSEVITVTAYEQGKSLQIKYNSKTYNLIPYAE